MYIKQIENISAETLPNGTTVYISKNHRFGTDAMLLAHFANLHRDETACDLGTGCGIIPLKWYDAGHRATVIGVEIEEEAASLFAHSLQKNNITNIQVENIDMRKLPSGKYVHVVTCNPPYFTGGFISENNAKATARHELSCTMQEVAKTAASLLKDGGRFCVCQRPERLTDVLCAMRENKIEPKHIRFVRQRKTSETPWLVLVDGRKGGKPGLHFQADLVMEQEDGKFTKEVLTIYGKEQAT